MPTADEQMARLVEQLQAAPGLAEQLPMEQGAIVRDALDGKDIHAVASDRRVPETTVWEVLGNAARMASGHAPAQRAETAGLGSDTDPGVSGGYGDTGFGAVEQVLAAAEEVT